MRGVRSRRLHLTILCAALSGCQTTLYDWGSYEPSLQRMYSPKYELVVGKEIQVLSKEIEGTQRRKRRVPPREAGPSRLLVCHARRLRRRPALL